MKSLKGKSICMFSCKGGTGKSTTALNLAGVFSCLNKKVLIIDFDLSSGGIAAMLNLNFDKSVYNLADDYINNRKADLNSYIYKYNENISIISSLKDPRQSSQIPSSYVEILLNKVSYEYDVIIMDMSHDLSKFNVTILDNSDMVLINLTNDLIDLKNARNLVKIFNDAGKKNYRFLLNEYLYPHKKYYGLYDIKNMIKANVDYKIGDNFFFKNIDNFVADGKIITLENKFIKYYPKVYKTYVTICNDLMEMHDEK